MTYSKILGLVMCGFGGYLIGSAVGPNWNHLLLAVIGLASYILGSAIYDGKFDDDNA